MESEQDRTPLSCPSCSQPMRSLHVERYDGGTLTIDLCAQCYVIWFDHAESAQLAPAAVIELFKEIHTHRDEQRHPLAQDMHCPRCAGVLALTHDICKSGPLVYYRCAHDLGRLTPFFQFLREKKFVRSLSPLELTRVRAEIQHVACPSCGAAVDLEHSAACSYCGSPIAVLDADAVNAAMKSWAEAEARRVSGPATDPRVMALTSKLQALSQQAVPGLLIDDPLDKFAGEADLMHSCIGALGGLLASLSK